MKQKSTKPNVQPSISTDRPPVPASTWDDIWTRPVTRRAFGKTSAAVTTGTLLAVHGFSFKAMATSTSSVTSLTVDILRWEKFDMTSTLSYTGSGADRSEAFHDAVRRMSVTLSGLVPGSTAGPLAVRTEHREPVAPTPTFIRNELYTSGDNMGITTEYTEVDNPGVFTGSHQECTITVVSGYTLMIRYIWSY